MVKVTIKPKMHDGVQNVLNKMQQRDELDVNIDQYLCSFKQSNLVMSERQKIIYDFD